MKVKLLSLWLGPPPKWMSKFARQMQRFKSIEWWCHSPAGNNWNEQLSILNREASSILGTVCNKGKSDAICDFRPTYGELFPWWFNDCDWWGWCDLDLMFGDLDRILPELCADDFNAVTFKSQYLSGCFALFRNIPLTKRLWRMGDFQRILADPNYHCWDESGHHHGSGESFFEIMQRYGVRINFAPELYCYDTPDTPQPIKMEDGKIIDLKTGEEKAFVHFMSDVWPLKEDGTSRWL